MKKVKIGLHKKYYGYATAVYENGSEIADYKSVPFIPFRKLRIKPEFLGNVKYFSPIPKVDIFHTYNNIVLNKHPWIVSFESFFPRFLGGYLNDSDAMNWGLNKLKSEHCKFILPISDAAMNLFYNTIKKYDMDPGIFAHKTKIIYPGIQPPANKILRADKNINLIFIGNLFFLKGGRVVINVFEELIKHYDNLRMTIISNMSYGDHISLTTASDQEIYINKMLKNQKIRWLKNVPHEKILNHYIPQSDINLLPTFDDTFGFVIAEAMLAGLPTIATNIFAIPEMIDHGKNGFMMELPLDENRQIQGFWENNFDKKRNIIFEYEDLMKSQLKNNLLKLIEDETLRKVMGEKSREIGLTKFDYKIRNKKIEVIYRKNIN